jgi:hypothetical protein
MERFGRHGAAAPLLEMTLPLSDGEGSEIAELSTTNLVTR